MRSITALLMLLSWPALSVAAELLSEKALEETTARGRQAEFSETVTAGSTTTVDIQNLNRISLTIGARSQTNLRGGAVTNAAGRNQIANGINLR